MVSFLISFEVVHNLLAFHCYLHRHDHLYQMNIGPVCPFHYYHCPRMIITKIIKTKNHETMKPMGRLKNRPTKKPYSSQVSSKTTTFYLHRSSWQKQLKEAISNWTCGCNTPQKIGKTAVMKCKWNCKQKTTNGYSTYTFASFSCRNWMILSSSLTSIFESLDSSGSDPGLRTKWTACWRFSLWFMVRFRNSKKSLR